MEKIAFFHQNEVSGAQGGIERFLATLLEQAPDTSFLVTEESKQIQKQRLGLKFPFSGKLPRWASYIAAVFLNAGRIKKFLCEHSVTALEFSRPEYAVFAMLFKGRKTFTFHGTGPLPKEPAKWLLHFASCWLLPFCADTIQIVGRNPGGFPRPLQRFMKSKIRFTDAWFDDIFVCRPYPNESGKIKFFYAGRIAKAKNPALLFAVIREAYRAFSGAITFVYCGADSPLLPQDLVGYAIDDRGMLAAPELARVMAECHCGLLTSFTEGSPFIIIESLACGRGFLLPPISGLLERYKGYPGVVFAENYSLDEYIQKISYIAGEIRSGQSAPQAISAAVQSCSKKQSCTRVFANITGESLS